MILKIVIITALLFPARALAQGPTENLESEDTFIQLVPAVADSKLPIGIPCEVEGRRYRCFTLNEMKELFIMENELRYFKTNYTNMFDKNLVLEQEIVQWELKFDASEEQNVFLTEDRERITLKWEEENRLRLKAENTPKFGNPLAWGLAGTFLLSTIALSLYVSLR